MNNKIVIPCAFGNLVVEKNIDEDYKEVFIGVEEDGVWVQDIAIVRNAYHYDNEGNVVLDDYAEVLIYADPNNEDYTNRFYVNKCVFNEGSV